MSQTVWPYLFYADVDAASEFLQRAFGFRDVDRQIGADVGTHLEFETPGGGRVYAAQMETEGRSGMVYVPNQGSRGAQSAPARPASSRSSAAPAANSSVISLRSGARPRREPSFA